MDKGVVDTHLHIWDLEVVPIPWLAPGAPLPPGFDTSSFAGDYLPEDYRRETHGRIVGAVYVPVESADWFAEARWVQEQADRTGVPDVMLAFGAPAASDFEGYLQRIGGFDRLRGVAISFMSGENVLENPAFRRGLQQMADCNLNLEGVVMIDRLPAFAEIADAFPQMQLVLPHMGRPSADTRDEWRRNMRELAKRPNVTVKVTGLGAIDRDYDLSVVRPFVEDTIGMFGVDRCIYGSNMPVDKQFRSFESQIEKYAELFRDMRADERDRLFRTNAQRVYRFQQAR